MVLQFALTGSLDAKVDGLSSRVRWWYQQTTKHDSPSMYRRRSGNHTRPESLPEREGKAPCSLCCKDKPERKTVQPHAKLCSQSMSLAGLSLNCKPETKPSQDPLHTRRRTVSMICICMSYYPRCACTANPLPLLSATPDPITFPSCGATPCKLNAAAPHGIAMRK